MTGSVVPTLTILATLSATSEWIDAYEGKKRGLDATTIESDQLVLAYLKQTLPELESSIMQMQTMSVSWMAEKEATVSGQMVRLFNLLNLIKQCRLAFQHIHQRLLTLFPAITPESIEEARGLYRACDHLFVTMSETGFIPVGTFPDRAMQFCTKIRVALDV